MLPHHATTRQQRYQHLVNDGVLPKEAQRDTARKEWKEKKQGRIISQRTTQADACTQKTYTIK